MIKTLSKSFAGLAFAGLAALPVSGVSSTLDEYRDQAYERAECPAYEGESQRECRERLKGNSDNRNADWRPTVEEGEIYTPSLESPAYSRDGTPRYNYGGEPGWEQIQRGGRNQKYRNDARYYGDCTEGEKPDECRGKIGQNKNYDNNSRYGSECGPNVTQEECESRSGNNQNYRNDARYMGECGPGESQQECDARIGQNRNYQNDARYYGECGVGESDEECAARIGQNKNYQNDSRYYGSCPARADETQEECENRLSSKDKDKGDFGKAGSGSDPYAGIPGNGGSSDPYSGIPKDRNQGGDRDWSKDGWDNEYGNVNNGNFGGYDRNKEDWDTLKNKEQEFRDGVDQNFNTDGLMKDKEKGSPLLTLIFCHLQIPFEGVSKVYGDKTCRRAVKDLCSFDVKDMDISGPHQCVGFAPWNM